MNLSCGIVGLPNVGKSTLFNALLKRQIAQVAEYPYTTIEPNVGVVEVPDERLDKLAQVLKIPKKVPAAIKFIDIAGLIKGAHQGEGLGNQFLAHIREVDAILHVVRVFANPEVSHVHGKIEPKEDIEVVNLELELSGIRKPTLYVLNVSESDLKHEFNFSFSYLKICAKLESELSDLEEVEQKAYLRELGVEKTGLDQVILESFKLLDLITFFTIVGAKQVQAWPIKRDKTAIEAAEIVHSDFAKGFIVAEVINWKDLVEAGNWHAAKEKGVVKTVGKSEKIEDGQVVEFKFNI